MIHEILADVEALLRPTLLAPLLPSWHLIRETYPACTPLSPHHPPKLGLLSCLAAPDGLAMHVLECKVHFSSLFEGTHSMKPGLTRILLNNFVY